MQGKSQTISLRLSPIDYDFLATSNWAEANTLSEKLRELIAQARQRDELLNNTKAYIKAVANHSHALTNSVHQVELKANTHSEVIQNTLILLPQLVTLLHDRPQDDMEALAHTERQLCELIFRFITNLARQALTEQGPSYDASLITQYFKEIKPTLEAVLNLPHINTV